jgi:hypothetical protein
MMNIEISNQQDNRIAELGNREEKDIENTQ